MPAVIPPPTPSVTAPAGQLAGRVGSRLERSRARESASICRVLLAAEPGRRAEELTGMLRERGYLVTVVGDGYELMNAWTFAWLASAAQPFEVIVTDGALPLLSGPEAVLELQQLSDCRATCVVAVSGADGDLWELDEIVSQVRSAFWPGPVRRKRACA